MVGDILQPTHLLFILVIALLVLGPKRLPEVGKSLGRGIRDFRVAVSGEDHDHNEGYTEQTAVEPPAAPVVPAPSAAPEPQPAAVAAAVGISDEHAS